MYCPHRVQTQGLDRPHTVLVVVVEQGELTRERYILVHSPDGRGTAARRTRRFVINK